MTETQTVRPSLSASRASASSRTTTSLLLASNTSVTPEVLFRPSFQPAVSMSLPFQTNLERDVDIRKNLYVNVVLASDTNMNVFQEVLGASRHSACHLLGKLMAKMLWLYLCRLWRCDCRMWHCDPCSCACCAHRLSVMHLVIGPCSSPSQCSTRLTRRRCTPDELFLK